MRTLSSFDKSQLPLAKSFYERECGQLSRPDRKGWARVKQGCPFHASESKKSFFVNLDGGFYCFGCDARGGDVIEFVRRRYRLSFPEALKHLNIESDYKPTPKPKEPPMSLERRLARKLALAVEYGMEAPID
jgi:DNA primase